MIAARWSALLLTVLLAATVAAQQPPFNNNRAGSRLKQLSLSLGQFVPADGGVLPQRPSHHPLNTDLGEGVSPEELLANRLRLPRDLQKLQQQLKNKQLPDEVMQLAQRLMANEEFLRSLRDRFSPEDLLRLRDRLQRGEGLAGDETLRRLFQEGLGNRQLSGREQQDLERWVDKLGSNSPGPVAPPNNPSSPTNPTPPPTAPQQITPSTPISPQSNSWLQKQMQSFSRQMSDWLSSPAGRAWRDRFLEFTQRNAPAGSALVERARGLTGNLPSVSRYLPRLPRLPRLPNVGLPRLPSASNMPRLSSLSAGSAFQSGKGLIWLVVLGLVVVALWLLLSVRQRIQQRQRSAWRPGPWPVRPEELASREEVVRGYEYLCLLTLGLPARSRHHLELAEQLAKQPALDPERRQQAALDLARTYERARYAPEQETLSPADLRRASRDLCYLAGVAA